MNAEILCVGTELLLGDIVNTNAAHIARGLAQCGIGCYYQTVVGDNADRLKQAVEHALGRSDLLITTGGLGPTYDDLTKETVAEYFGLEMELHEPSLEKIRCLFENMHFEMTKNNEKQAYMPTGAHILENDNGTAPGLILEKDGKTVIMLPGPPREMTAMFDGKVLPYLSKQSSTTFVSHTIHLFGVGESTVEDMLREKMEALTNPTLAPYAKEGEVQLRLTASAASGEEAEALMAPVLEELCEQLEKYVYGVDVESLQNALVCELRGRGLRIAVAESITCGLVASRIAEISGASEVLEYGACTYSNDAKIRMLGVPPQVIAQHTAVSAETAEKMAAGIRKLSGADIGLSVTGYASPDPKNPEAETGLVYIAVCSDKMESVKELHLGRGYRNERNLIRHIASSYALNAALRCARLYPEA